MKSASQTGALDPGDGLQPATNPVTGSRSPGFEDALSDAAPGARRAVWAERRGHMEKHHEKRTPDGRHRKRKWRLFRFLIRRFGMLLWCCGLYRRGVRNALNIGLNRIEVEFDNLPDAFDGYTILHLSDLHCDGLDALEERLIALVQGFAVDVMVLTGDYRYRVTGSFAKAIPPLEALRRAVTVRDGALATLGNHDSIDMVEPLEQAGFRVLANETVSLRRGGSEIHLIGIDDVHYYFTQQAVHALRDAPAGFRIALVHSPEFAEQAAAADVSLYLTGHTHGGQICLPGALPILTNSVGRRSHARGVWRCGGMAGYTSTGVGVSGLPVRYNSRGEVALITLRKARPRGAGRTTERTAQLIDA